MTTTLDALPVDPDRSWVVRVTLATHQKLAEDALVELDEQAERHHDAMVAARADQPGLVFTAEVAGDQVTEVASWATALAEPIAPGVWLVDLSVTSPEEYEANALRPDIELAGVSEASELLRVSRQRLAVLRQRPDFPAPLVDLAQGPVWAVAALRSYDSERNHDAGRPRLRDIEAR